MKKNNKGYSLVELIVVIAILAVIVSVVTYSIGIVFRNRSREAASDFNSMLSSAKMAALSGEFYTTSSGDENPKLELYILGDEYTADLHTISETTATQVEDLGADTLGLTYSLDNGATVVNIDSTFTATNPISFSYNKETGALESFIVPGQTIDLSTVNTIILDFGSGYDITIYPATGYQEFM